MPRLPGEDFFNGIPSPRSGRPIAREDTSARYEGAKAFGRGLQEAGDATTGFAKAVAKRDIAFEAGFEEFRDGERSRIAKAVQNAGADSGADLLAEYDRNATDYLEGLPRRQQRRFEPQILEERNRIADAFDNIAREQQVRNSTAALQPTVAAAPASSRSPVAAGFNLTGGQPLSVRPESLEWTPPVLVAPAPAPPPYEGPDQIAPTTDSVVGVGGRLVWANAMPENFSQAVPQQGQAAASANDGTAREAADLVPAATADDATQPLRTLEEVRAAAVRDTAMLFRPPQLEIPSRAGQVPAIGHVQTEATNVPAGAPMTVEQFAQQQLEQVPQPNQPRFYTGEEGIHWGPEGRPAPDQTHIWNAPVHPEALRAWLIYGPHSATPNPDLAQSNYVPLPLQIAGRAVADVVGGIPDLVNLGVNYLLGVADAFAEIFGGNVDFRFGMVSDEIANLAAAGFEAITGLEAQDPANMTDLDRLAYEGGRIALSSLNLAAIGRNVVRRFDDVVPTPTVRPASTVGDAGAAPVGTIADAAASRAGFQPYWLAPRQSFREDYDVDAQGYMTVRDRNGQPVIGPDGHPVRVRAIDENGTILVSRLGVPLDSARHVVGPRDIGGADVELPPGVLEQFYRELGVQLRFVSPEEIARRFPELAGAAGVTNVDGGRISVFIDNTLDNFDTLLTGHHEGGHVFQVLSGEPAITQALFNRHRQLYNYNNLESIRLNYLEEAYPYEYAAEAWRLALFNPAYLKTVAPQIYWDIADRIRNDPILSQWFVLAALEGNASAGIPTQEIQQT